MTNCTVCGKPVIPGQHSRFDPDTLAWEPLCAECVANQDEYQEALSRARHNDERVRNHEDFYAVLCDC